MAYQPTAEDYANANQAYDEAGNHWYGNSDEAKSLARDTYLKGRQSAYESDALNKTITDAVAAAKVNSDAYMTKSVDALNSAWMDSKNYYDTYSQAGSKASADLESWRPYQAEKYSFDSSKVLNDPIVQWQLKQAERSANNQLASKGVLGGGRAEALRIGNRADVLGRATNDAFNRDFSTFGANTQNAFNSSGQRYNQLIGTRDSGQTANAAMATNRLNTGANIASTYAGTGAQTTGIIGQGMNTQANVGMNSENNAFKQSMVELQRKYGLTDEAMNGFYAVLGTAGGVAKSVLSNPAIMSG